MMRFISSRFYFRGHDKEKRGMLQKITFLLFHLHFLFVYVILDDYERQNEKRIKKNW